MSLREDILTQNIVKEDIDIIQEKIQSDVIESPNLTELDSVSKTANYKQWIYVVSYVSWMFSQLWDRKKAEHQKIIDDNVAPNDRWVANILRQFQFGDSLEFDTNFKPAYPVIDLDKQVIEFVSIRSSNGVFIALVAGDDGEGNPIALTLAQLDASNAYLDEYILGKNGSIESRDADLAQIHYKIYYNAERSKADIEEEIEPIIKSYLASLNFKGQYVQAHLEDQIQSVTNVEYYEKVDVQFKESDGEYEAGGIVYEPTAGYIKIDEAFPLSATLTYQAV